MSSFRRIVKPTSSDSNSEDNNKKNNSNRIPGVKPWIQSASGGLVSTGNKQLDDLLGGGAALGTVVLLTVDNFSNYSDTFLFYNIAESISLKHNSLLVVENKMKANFYIGSLPYNLTYASKEKELFDDNNNNNNVSSSIDKNKVLSEIKFQHQLGDYIFSG